MSLKMTMSSLNSSMADVCPLQENALPGAAAQVIGALYVLATAKILKGIINDDRVPEKFKCKGLLIKRKDQMTLYTLNVNVASVCSASVSVIYQDLHLGVNFLFCEYESRFVNVCIICEYESRFVNVLFVSMRVGLLMYYL